MYLRTPKRYSGRDDRKRLISLKWLWLYLIAPVILVAAVLVWDNRATISPRIGEQIDKGLSRIHINAPTLTPTIPGPVLKNNLIQALQAGKVETAMDALQALTDLEPNNAQLFSMQSMFIIDHVYTTGESDLKMPAVKARLDMALQYAEQAIDANPEIADGWIAKAIALNQLYRSQEALPYVLRAKDIDNKNAMMMAVLGETYHDLHKYKEATDSLDVAIKAAQTQVPLSRSALAYAYYWRGIVAADAGEGTDAAIKYLELAWNTANQKYSPANMLDFVPPGYIVASLGSFYVFKNQTDLALKRYTDALQIDQQDPYLYYLRGRVYLNGGRTPDAIKEFQSCTDLDPKQVRCLRNLGMQAYVALNWQNAIKYLSIVAEQKSQIANDYYLLGSAYDKFNHQCDAAVPILQQGYNLADDKAAPTRADFAELLNTCNAAPVQPTSVPTESATLPPVESASTAAATPTVVPPPPPK